ncbi:IS701 family transposase [Kitasatospora sp. NPDC059463]|uniref:IS701 family transposase n=1 Tax=unclassified Kitasatospora TaxID=2633591 RepID=UPI0036A783D6
MLPHCPVATVPPHPTDRLSAFADVLFVHLQRADQRRRGHAYLHGLLTAPGKKTVRHLAAAVTDSPTASQSLQQFVNSSPWPWEPVRRELARWAEAHLRPRAWTVVTTVVPKRGDHSCGVHRRFVPQLGRTVNCQVGTGLFLAGPTAAVPVDWRLHLPQEWSLPSLRRRARVPRDAPGQPIWADTFDMVERLKRSGIAPAPIVADLRDSKETAGLLRLLTHHCHDFVLAVPGVFAVLPLDETGRDLPAAACVSPPGVRHTLVRLPSAAGARARETYRLFTDPRYPTVVWITNLVRRRPEDLLALVSCHAGTGEAVRELTQDFGLQDFEGRSYPGWHHYMTLMSAAYAYRTLADTG